MKFGLRRLGVSKAFGKAFNEVEEISQELATKEPFTEKLDDIADDLTGKETHIAEKIEEYESELNEDEHKIVNEVNNVEGDLGKDEQIIVEKFDEIDVKGDE